jgi:putative GTP pyrophosphokinase
MPQSDNDRIALETEYRGLLGLAEHFAQALVEQLGQLLSDSEIELSFPIQKRIKSWQSIDDKLERRSIALSSITDLGDLVGLRIILQFQRDVSRVCSLLDQHFTVVEHQETTDKLEADKFGYASTHYVIALPDTWLTVPTLASMGELRAELQVRTTAQHIWAAASHVFQYKHESSVPFPVRRSLHRVAALLEIVDSEFDRVLKQRDTYRKNIGPYAPTEELNVDLLEHILDEYLPSANKEHDEAYSVLLEDLRHFDISTAGQLSNLLEEHRDAILKEDAHIVSLLRNKKTRERSGYHFDQSRAARGVFYVHVGLVREALGCSFGTRWREYIHGRSKYSSVEDEFVGDDPVEGDEVHE